jgi:50S ribosomal protein L16 3-hydroxylase
MKRDFGSRVNAPQHSKKPMRGTRGHAPGLPAQTAIRARTAMRAHSAMPAETHGTAKQPLGMSPARFMRDHWQKAPLLVRGAYAHLCAQLQAEVSRDTMFALATREDVQSRLVVRQPMSAAGARNAQISAARSDARSSAKRTANSATKSTANEAANTSATQSAWTLAHGPFRRARKGALPARDWTLLVQGLNLHLPACDALMRGFGFVPYARLDDVMASYAVEGGGVGPHVDSYDVFLLQSHGQRHWRISHQADLSLVEGLPLKILQRFQPTAGFTLGPGDMLYLPPGWAHDGVAVQGDCITLSIGFRAPQARELQQSLLHYLEDNLPDDPRLYADPWQRATTQPAEITPAMLAEAARLLQDVTGKTSGKPNAKHGGLPQATLADFLGQYLTEPQWNTAFAPPETPLTPNRFAQAVLKRGVALDLRTQCLTFGQTVFINGQVLPCDPQGVLAMLANLRKLAPLISIDASLGATLWEWYEEGWLHLA